MLKPRIRAGLPRATLLGLGLLALTGLPAAAQNWPSDSGPVGDFLGSSVRQFERLSPPPVETEIRNERIIPDMPPTDVPGGNVDVGMPSIVRGADLRPPAPAPALRSRPAARRQAVPARSTARARGTPRGGATGELNRELLDLRQEIRELRREIDQQRLSLRGAPSGGATYTPR